MIPTPAPRWHFALAGLSLVAALALGALGTLSVQSDDAVTQPEHRCGWTPSAAGDLVAADAPPFTIEGRPEGSSSEGAQVYLWEMEQRINGGEHFPCLRQETGDCTSFGAAGAMHTLQARMIAQGAPIAFHPVYPPFYYGVARTAKDIGNGQLGRSAGAVGRWIVEAATKYGTLRADAPGVPVYSGKLADQWGYSGVPQEFFDQAEPFKLGSYGKVTTWDQLRDAIALTGSPCTIACDVGYRMEQKMFEGKRFGQRSGSWAHQMYFKGIDDQARCPDGSVGAVYLMNSWGANAHSPPAGDEPPGGFWISRRDTEYMLDRPHAECYALSLFEGFHYQPLNIPAFFDGPAGDVVDLPPAGPGTKYLAEFAGIDTRTVRVAGTVCTGIVLPLVVAGVRARRKQGISPHSVA